jgi:hypothetical protein
VLKITNKISIPILLDLNEDLAWCIGFYFAEGDKTRDYIGVSNCNIDLIKRFQTIMEEIFKIDRSLWKVHIKTSNKNLNYVKNKWKSSLNLDNINVLYNELAKEDNIELRFNSRQFAGFFNNLLGDSITKILSSKTLSIAFLNGYEVGDGSVIQRKGFLYGIAFTTKNNANKDLIVKMFNLHYNIKPRVRISKGSFEIEICGINLMTDLILDGHFNSHKRKWNTLVQTYLKKQYTRSHIRYWRVLRNSKGILDISKLANRSHWSVRDALNKDSKLGIVEVLNKKPKIYKLSRKGEDLLNILEGVNV